MTTKVVCRLLTEAGALLGWAEIQAVARGDGQLWSPGAVTVIADARGFGQVISLHWCDVNVETRVPCALAVEPGQVATIYASASPLIRVGPAASGLPAVTLRSRVAVPVPVGVLGARR